MRKKIVVLVGVLAVLMGHSLSAEASTTKVKAKGSAPYGLGASSKVRNLAIEDAKKKAVRKYAANFDSARYKVFEQAFGRVEQNIDLYVMSYVIIDSGKNKTAKTYDVYIEATINDNEVEKLVGGIGASMASSSGESPYITLVMVGREVETRKSYKAKKTDIQEKTKGGASEDNISVQEGGISTDFYNEEISKHTTGGSVERKSDQVKFRCFPVADVDAAIGEVFTKAGYEVVDPRDVELDVFMFQTEFSAGADITTSSRRDAIRQCRELDVAFFGVGYMDVGLPEKDPATGMDRVYVKVTVKISDLRKRLPKTVASMRGIQYAGLGSNPQVARQNALNIAAQKSSKNLVDQLRSKGIKAN